MSEEDTKMVVLPLFTRKKGEVTNFINICRLYLRLNMEGACEEDKVVWVLRYMQEGSVEVWKDNVIKEVEQGMVGFHTVNNLYEKI